MLRILIFLSLFLPALASAEPQVCFLGPVNGPNAELRLEDLVVLAAYPTCQTMDGISRGLDATSVVLSITGWGLACTGIGATVTVWLKGAGYAAQAFSLLVKELPCEKPDSKAEVQKLAEDIVCDSLARSGITCTIHP